MFVASIIVSALLAIAVGGSGYNKLIKNETILKGMDVVRVPRDRVWMLGVLEVAAALGLVVGIFWWPIGVAAAIGVIVYFVGAVIAHLRVSDTKGVGAPAVLLLVGVAALVLRLLSV
ncbi:DoxX-like family protein [Agreia bicolorata]|uniref:DoxX-like family protein n=1 Tax=Agreia bicolorata TaxID=110935 RepID=A0A1T4X0U4_9MICO|nr:DoxX family protein [Agreia bicolorata]KJC63700.1 membrane protein [Agreia bicolorata]SKA82491.1 DoxX-like family protein [Agreia bicolorata]